MTTTPLITLPATLRALRIASGLTQAQVEQKCDIGFANLADIERGGADPTLDTLRKMARLYNQVIKIEIAP